MSELLNYARTTMKTTVHNYWYSVPGAIQCDEQNIAMSYALQSALMSLPHSEFKPPKLVAVGTQSSGKSSLLNALIGYDLLPVGDTMTTRTAIQIQLICTKEQTQVEFGNYSNGKWISSRYIGINPTPTTEQQKLIKDYISEQTNIKTNGNKGICSSPISIRLYSSNVPNLSFVDLPGLTMTALTSQGQPENMCAQIRDLIASYIDERTIILLVCAARADLEADAALELCKKITNGKQTVGCLTKVDLCDSNINAYLKNTQAQDLSLEHGYFAVKCRSAVGENMQARYLSEKNFFVSQAQYKQNAHRTGISNLAQAVYQLFIEKIKSSIPTLKIELEKMKDEAKIQFDSNLGSIVPPTASSKYAFVNDILTKCCNDLNSKITARRPDTSSGRIIRQTFGKLRIHTRSISPFTKEQFTDDEIMTAVRNCQGWSMVSPVPSVQIVEFFLQHSKTRPIQKIVGPCAEALNEVYMHIQDEVDKIIEKYDQFQDLVDWMKENVHVFLREQQLSTYEQIKHAVSVEEVYIFTDNEAFIKEWTAATQPETTASLSYPTTLRLILAAYFSVVTESVANYIPKLIVYSITHTLQSLQPYMVSKLQSTTHVERLLLESIETEKLRMALTNTISTADNCLRTIERAMK